MHRLIGEATAADPEFHLLTPEDLFDLRTKDLWPLSEEVVAWAHTRDTSKLPAFLKKLIAERCAGNTDEAIASVLQLCGSARNAAVTDSRRIPGGPLAVAEDDDEGTVVLPRAPLVPKGEGCPEAEAALARLFWGPVRGHLPGSGGADEGLLLQLVRTAPVLGIDLRADEFDSIFGPMTGAQRRGAMWPFSEPRAAQVRAFVEGAMAHVEGEAEEVQLRQLLSAMWAVYPWRSSIGHFFLRAPAAELPTDCRPPEGFATLGDALQSANMPIRLAAMHALKKLSRTIKDDQKHYVSLITARKNMSTFGSERQMKALQAAAAAEPFPPGQRGPEALLVAAMRVPCSGMKLDCVRAFMYALGAHGAMSEEFDDNALPLGHGPGSLELVEVMLAAARSWHADVASLGEPPAELSALGDAPVSLHGFLSALSGILSGNGWVADSLANINGLDAPRARAALAAAARIHGPGTAQLWRELTAEAMNTEWPILAVETPPCEVGLRGTLHTSHEYKEARPFPREYFHENPPTELVRFELRVDPSRPNTRLLTPVRFDICKWLVAHGVVPYEEPQMEAISPWRYAAFTRNVSPSVFYDKEECDAVLQRWLEEQKTKHRERADGKHLKLLSMVHEAVGAFRKTKAPRQSKAAASSAKAVGDAEAGVALRSHCDGNDPSAGNTHVQSDVDDDRFQGGLLRVDVFSAGHAAWLRDLATSLPAGAVAVHDAMPRVPQPGVATAATLARLPPRVAEAVFGRALMVMGNLRGRPHSVSPLLPPAAPRESGGDDEERDVAVPSAAPSSTRGKRKAR